VDAQAAPTREVTMAGQEHARPQRRDGDDEAEPMPAPAPAAQAQDTEVDALLEEIDEVLESNAEQFVRGFVQKGGQ
jgi:prokaryotic ubiquitin-like protein Pup